MLAGIALSRKAPDASGRVPAGRMGTEWAQRFDARAAYATEGDREYLSLLPDLNAEPERVETVDDDTLLDRYARLARARKAAQRACAKRGKAWF